MDFQLTDRQRESRGGARRLAQGVFTPEVDRLDEAEGHRRNNGRALAEASFVVTVGGGTAQVTPYLLTPGVPGCPPAGG